MEKDIEKFYMEKLIEVQKEEDEEVRHAKEDGVLCQLLNNLGYGRIVTQYRKTTKYYA